MTATPPNIPAIRAVVSHIGTAYAAGNRRALYEGLTGLSRLVPPLQGGETLAAEFRRLCSGRSAIDRGELDGALRRVTAAIDSFAMVSRPPLVEVPEDTAGSGVHGTVDRYRIAPRPHSITPRPDQAYIAQRARGHFITPDESGNRPKRGIFRFDTGMGKSATYGFIFESLRRAMSNVFDDAIVIMASHQEQPARDMGEQIKTIFPWWDVAFLKTGVKLPDLSDARFVVGTYQQLAQEGTVELLKAWAGRRRILFVLDEADMVVFKGIKEIQEDQVDEETGWHASWSAVDRVRAL